MTTEQNIIAFDDCVDFDPMTVFLSGGSHGEEFNGQCCLVEAANQATRACKTLGERFGVAEQFDDSHPSVSPVIRSFAIGLNDAWNDEDRQRLRPYVTKILGTKTTPEDDETRAWMATDWLCRVHTPAFLRLAGLEEHARALESLARIVDAVTASSAQPTLNAARVASAAARAAARDAAWAAAGAAARAAAGDAARDAARDAAWAAARAAAGDAARDAAWDAARDAAWDAARDAAWAAARAAAWAAAWAAARDALRPAVDALQNSALDLFDAMIAVGAESPSPSRTDQ